MSKVPVTVEAPKEFHELADGLVALVSVLKTKLADGWQLSDAPALFQAVTAFMPCLKGVEQLPAEAKDDPEAFVICGTLALAGIVKAVRS
jgi:hypothetical protein